MRAATILPINGDARAFAHPSHELAEDALLLDLDVRPEAPVDRDAPVARLHALPRAAHAIRELRVGGGRARHRIYPEDPGSCLSGCLQKSPPGAELVVAVGPEMRLPEFFAPFRSAKPQGRQ